MTAGPRTTAPRPGPDAERLQRWIAGLATLLLHLVLVALALWVAPLVMSNPEGAAGGARIEVEYVERPDSIPSPPEFPRQVPEPTPAPRPVPEPVRRRDATPLQATPVVQAEDALPPETGPPRETTPSPPATGTPAPRARRHGRGLPPGMLPDDHAPLNVAPAPVPAVYRGRRYHASAAEPNLEVGGFQVIYDLVSDARLRAWRDEGMTELWLPLPGVRQRMVCPLETALRRGSGPCRMVEPDDPALEMIGDARKVISMDRVYRRGEPVWLGPGPYR